NSPSIAICPAKARHVALVSLDKVYFEKFALAFARKFFVTNPGNGLHFHCIGFDPAETIRGWRLAGAVGWTVDLEDLASFRPREKRGYYAAARYIFLSRYLELYDSVFVADVDGLVRRDLATIAEEHARND